MSEFMAMGGYAGFVWSTYLLAAVVMGGLFVASWRGLKTRQAQLNQLQAARDAALGRRRGAGRSQEKDTP